MLAGFLLGIVHDRRMLREAQVNLAIRWFVGYGLHEFFFIGDYERYGLNGWDPAP